MNYYCYNCNSEPAYLTTITDPDSADFDKQYCPRCGSTSVNKIEIEEHDIKQFAAELERLKNEEPATVLIPPLAAFAIVTHIQLASRHPDANTIITEMAIKTAHQLQKLFDPKSLTAKVLNMGWNPEHDRPIGKKS